MDAVLRLSLAGAGIKTAADAFGGLGTIGAALRARNIHVTTCDLLKMPHAFQYSRIVSIRRPRYLAVRKSLGLKSSQEFQSYIGRLKSGRSWIVREFSDDRKFFLKQNASKIAGIWHALKSWKEEELLSKAEECHLVASLVNSADLCANTAGTYYAHLKKWDRRALRDFQFDWIPLSNGGISGRALLGDALESLAGKSFDLLYLDPPYNSRDYSRYYHFPESLASLERPKTNKDSAAGVPLIEGRNFGKATHAWVGDYVSKLIAAVNWGRCVLHYCDEAFVPLDVMREILSEYGVVEEYEVDALGYTTVSKRRGTMHRIFIVDNKLYAPS